MYIKDLSSTDDTDQLVNKLHEHITSHLILQALVMLMQKTGIESFELDFATMYDECAHSGVFLLPKKDKAVIVVGPKERDEYDAEVKKLHKVVGDFCDSMWNEFASGETVPPENEMASVIYANTGYNPEAAYSRINLVPMPPKTKEAVSLILPPKGIVKPH